jgi:glycosyltransferase involved in cell wall biosynthesis
MHGLEERRNYAMGREAKKGRASHFRWKNRVWQRLYYMPMYHRAFATADQCIVTNRESLVFLQLRYNLPPDRTWYVPNGVGSEFFRVRQASESAGVKLLFVGTWIDHKGTYYLAQAFEKLSAAFPQARLTIAGCGAPEGEVRQCFAPSVQSVLDVRPFISRADMPGLYAGHDIFLLPSLMEGMPLVLLEAMASGMAVVTTESNGMTDLVEDSQDGLFAIPGDVNSLFCAIQKLCRNARLRQQLGAAAQEKMKRFTWKRMAERHEAIFCRAMGAPPAIPGNGLAQDQAEQQIAGPSGHEPA